MIYALYRGDEFIDIGTAKELARKRGISPFSITFKATPSYHRRASDKAVKAYRIEEDENDES